jgi:CubicO group peptidase (beta-lactamase class C family)
VNKCRHPKFAILFLTVTLLITGCGSDTSSTANPLPYTAAIAEGQEAAQEALAETGASSLSLALVEGERLVWTQTFGLADKESKAAPTVETMYGIGSVSKMIATIAVMKLVDQGRLLLDAPLVNYLPAFRMASPEYTQVTVRMLVNHSSGFPGMDDRGLFTFSPVPGYSAQVSETLRGQRLKHPPGYLNTYCNDGFTMVEQLVLAVTGKSYARFVQDEILGPLGMNRSGYPLDYFPAGTFARVYQNGALQPKPQQFSNGLAQGGLYSTPSDMAKIVSMLIGKGKYGSQRILSESSVAAMGIDQTVGTFNPVISYTSKYGLGWDSVTEPGLMAVNVRAWSKGGYVISYGAVMVVLPDDGLGIVITGASGIDDSKATVIAQRVLLRALVEKGRIEAFPTKLNPSPLPVQSPTPPNITGEYATSINLFRIQQQPDGSLSTAQVSATGWQFDPGAWKYRTDGWFTTDEDSNTGYSFQTFEGRHYWVQRSVAGYGHYRDSGLFATQVAPSLPLSAAWSGRLARQWLVTNEHPDSQFYLRIAESGPRLVLVSFAGHFLVIPHTRKFYRLDPSASDTIAAMMLMTERDINDLVIETRGGEEWAKFGSYIYRPLASVTQLPSGSNSTVTIGTEGLGEWRSISGISTSTMTITNAQYWKLFDPSLKMIDQGKGAGSRNLHAASGAYYLLMYGNAGDAVTISLI